jgi:hypothetical protein
MNASDDMSVFVNQCRYRGFDDDVAGVARLYRYSIELRDASVSRLSTNDAATAPRAALRSVNASLRTSAASLSTTVTLRVSALGESD